jgi:purine-binding chemotaxis protein CheW
VSVSTPEAAAREILEERARELARPLEEEERGESTSLLILGVGAERYGIDITTVQETRSLAQIAPLPNTPPFWRGLVNVRGRLCPVLDLGRYLHVADAVPTGLPEHDLRMLVVVAAAGLTVALVVDSVGEIRRLPVGAVKGSPAESTGGGSRAVIGVTQDLVSVLDVEELLGDPGLIVQQAG